jgi:hypothetical protein
MLSLAEWRVKRDLRGPETGEDRTGQTGPSAPAMRAPDRGWGAHRSGVRRTTRAAGQPRGHRAGQAARGGWALRSRGRAARGPAGRRALKDGDASPRPATRGTGEWIRPGALAAEAGLGAADLQGHPVVRAGDRVPASAFARRPCRLRVAPRPSGVPRPRRASAPRAPPGGGHPPRRGSPDGRPRGGSPGDAGGPRLIGPWAVLASPPRASAPG